MITSFDDFCTWMYVVIDDAWQQLAPLFARPGPAPTTGSDSEVLTLLLVGECCGWDQETALLRHWPRYRHLFPVLPERSRFNRRRRHLRHALNAIRRLLLEQFDLAWDRQCVIDSLPIPVMHFHLVPGSPATSRWKADGATFGKVPSKQQTIFGYKLHLLVTLNGVIRDFVLAPAHAPDLAVGAELLAEHHDLLALGDKAYISQPVATALAEERGVLLLTMPRRNQRDQAGAGLAALHTHWRQIIETVNEQLSDQFHIEENHAQTFSGLCARLFSKLTAHTLCVYLNRLLGQPDYLHIKALPFPN